MDILEFENQIYDSGYKNIAYIDEVGRGCLLGDVVACAIILPRDLRIQGVKDSKKLSEKKREYLFDIIENEATGIGIGRVDAQTIDRINIKESTRLAMKLAVKNIVNRDGNKIIADYLLIDAENIDLDIPQKSFIKGDDRCHGIACASIIAKVYRDRMCLEWDKMFPGYNIGKNKGYGTKEHRESILELGVTPIHRMTFLKNIIGK